MYENLKGLTLDDLLAALVQDSNERDQHGRAKGITMRSASGFSPRDPFSRSQRTYTRKLSADSDDRSAKSRQEFDLDSC